MTRPLKKRGRAYTGKKSTYILSPSYVNWHRLFFVFPYADANLVLKKYKNLTKRVCVCVRVKREWYRTKRFQLWSTRYSSKMNKIYCVYERF